MSDPWQYAISSDEHINAYRKRYGLEPYPEADMKLKPGEYYWIKREEPDGPPFWEPARFLYAVDGAGTHGADENGLCYYWELIRKGYPVRQVTTPGASNRWTIGEVLRKPPSAST